MDQNNIRLMFDLIKSSVCDVLLSDEEKTRATNDSINYVIKLSGKHYVHHLVFDGLYKNGLIDSNHSFFDRLHKIQARMIGQYENIEYTYSELCTFFENEKIAFMPLKGSVLRSGYKEGWMRHSCDIDILVNEEDAEKTIEKLINEKGYQYKAKTSYDYSLYSPGGIHLELHYSLVGDMISKETGSVVKKVWESAKIKEGYNYLYEMPDDMFYFYHITHMAKHFLTGGCGIKPFVDLLLLEKMAENDEGILQKRDILLKEGRLLKFAENVRKLYKVWFFEYEHDETTLSMEEYLFTGGVYGTSSNKVVINRQREGGRVKYAMARLFMPYEALKFRYPKLENRKYLMPYYTVRRWLEVFSKDRFQRISNEVDITNNLSSEEGNNISKLLKDLGL